jgi:hypothetical protein
VVLKGIGMLGRVKSKVVMQDLETTKDMKYYLGKILSGSESFILPIVMFFAPIKGVLITVGAFIILDTASGIWKSRVNKVPITSRRLSCVVSKMLLYESAVLCTYLLDFYILGDILESIFGIEGLLVKATALLLIYIESQSINENYKAAKGIDLWAEFKKLVQRSKEVTQSVVGVSDEVTNLKKGGISKH